MDILSEIIKRKILKEGKSYFLIASDATVTIGDNADNPSFLTGLQLIKNRGFELDATDGKIRNMTGKKINYMHGTISFQPDKTDASTTLMYMWGERSTDGVNWTHNVGSLRSLEIPGSGETFKTSVSAIRDFHVGEYMRFRMYVAGQGDVSFVPPSTISNGETIAGHSVIWELQEA